MKKKCTNSTCRRVFTPWFRDGIVTCPHCGKTYPRMQSPKNTVPSLVIYGTAPKCKKHEIFTVIYHTLGLTVMETSKIMRHLDQTPIILSNIPASRIRKQKAELEQLGALVRLDSTIPATPMPETEKRTYTMVLTGYDPGAQEEAYRYLKRMGPDHRHSPKEFLKKAIRNHVVLRTRIDQPEKENIAAMCRDLGIHVVFHRNRH